MKITKKGIEKFKNIIQYIVTFFAILSFVFLAILTGLGLLSNSAYKKFIKGSRYDKRD